MAARLHSVVKKNRSPAPARLYRVADNKQKDLANCEVFLFYKAATFLLKKSPAAQSL